MLPICNPWFERIGIIMNMTDDRAGPGKCTSHDEIKIDEKAVALVTTAGAQLRSPSGSRRLRQTIMHEIVVSADSESDPSKQVYRQGGSFLGNVDPTLNGTRKCRSQQVIVYDLHSRTDDLFNS